MCWQLKEQSRPHRLITGRRGGAMAPASLVGPSLRRARRETGSRDNVVLELDPSLARGDRF